MNDNEIFISQYISKYRDELHEVLIRNIIYILNLEHHEKCNTHSFYIKAEDLIKHCYKELNEIDRERLNEETLLLPANKKIFEELIDSFILKQLRKVSTIVDNIFSYPKRKHNGKILIIGKEKLIEYEFDYEPVESNIMPRYYYKIDLRRINNYEKQ